MARKKDFTDIAAIPTGKVTRTIAQATSTRNQQIPATPEEAAERAAELRTQGRKGCRAVRINMAFTPENHAFIKLMARGSGRTMTEMVNTIIAAYRNEHPEFLEHAKSYLDWLNSGLFKDIDGGE